MEQILNGKWIEEMVWYLHVQVKGKFMTHDEAENHLRKVLIIFDEVASKNLTDNYLAMFNNLSSSNQFHKETAERFYNKPSYWSPTFSDTSNALGNIAFDIEQAIEKYPTSIDERKELKKASNMLREISKETAFRK